MIHIFYRYNKAVVVLTGHDNPAPSNQFLVLDLQRVCASLEPVFLTENSFKM